MKLVALSSALVLLFGLGADATNQVEQAYQVDQLDQVEAYAKFQVTVSAIKIRVKPSTHSTAVGQYNHCDTVEFVQYYGQAEGYDWNVVHWRGKNYYAANGPVGGEAWMLPYPARGC